jgi:hypothetical protein
MGQSLFSEFPQSARAMSPLFERDSDLSAEVAMLHISSLEMESTTRAPGLSAGRAGILPDEGTSAPGNHGR